jgi:hypothetical protein
VQESRKHVLQVVWRRRVILKDAAHNSGFGRALVLYCVL